tara:strand:- start:193 stop:384 length:192 start_codon:yes stop_codon:yes gene_type:complete
MAPHSSGYIERERENECEKEEERKRERDRIREEETIQRPCVRDERSKRLHDGENERVRARKNE